MRAKEFTTEGANQVDFKKNLLTILQQKYPDTEFVAQSDRVESTDGELTVIADTAEEDSYVGCVMWDVSTGPYTGALGLAIKQTTEQLLQANPGKKPALFIDGDNENPEAWSHIANKLNYKLITDDELGEGVAEGLNEFAPDGFNGGDDGEEFNPRMAKMAYEAGIVKGTSLADGATLERAMAIDHWDSHDGGMYKQYFAKGFKQGRMNKIKHDNKQYNLNLKLMKDGSIRHGEKGVAENFADGKVKGKSRPGRVRRAGASCNGSVTDLRQRAKNASGERAKMYHWCANMKSGRNKS